MKQNNTLDLVEKNAYKWLIGAAAVITTGVIIKKVVDRRKSMLQRLIPFIGKWEGGLSHAKTDTASSYPAPWTYKGRSDWHTNRGITYATFVSLSSKLGYAVTPNNFFNMSNALWLKILKGGFLAPYPLGRIKHLPRIQAVIITWAWGSGLGGSEVRLANFQRDQMRIVDGNITKTEIVENFRSKIKRVNELKWFHRLCDRREADFRRMSTFPKNGKGWLRRLDEFRTVFG